MARLREGRANTVRGAAHFLRETVGRVRYAGASGRLTVRADSGLLCPRHRRRLPQDGCPLLHHHPPAQEPAQSHRGHTRGGLDSHPLLDGRRRRCGRDRLHSLQEQARCRAGAAHRPAGEAHARFPAGPIRQLQLSRLHHRPGRGYPWSWRPTIAATPRSRMPSETSSTASG